MANISITNPTISNTETSDVTKLTANDNDLLNGLTDGTKDISISKGTFAGVVDANAGMTVDGGNVTFNDGGGDYDFSIEGDTDTQLLKCDAGDDAVLMGSNANTTDFSAAKSVASHSDSGITSATRMGLVGEAATSSSDGCYGLMGAAGVAASADTGQAWGVYGVASSTHSGAANVGVFGEASGSTTTNYGVYGIANQATTGSNIAVFGNAASSSATNYSFYGAAGEILNVDTYAKAAGGTNRAMLVDNTGLFGNATSSLRYKKNVIDIPDTSWIYQLRPVMFDYIDESKGVECSGLIAEEVEQINKRLITYNDIGQPETVEYHRLIPMLLKEIQNLNDRIAVLESK